MRLKLHCTHALTKQYEFPYQLYLSGESSEADLATVSTGLNVVIFLTALNYLNEL